jgi:GNAT superfamily N-acetyltransferase
VLERSFGASAEGRQVVAYFDGLSQYPMSQYPAMRFYLGIYEGQTVATGTMFVGQETVGIYDIVTLAAYRRRGIGSAIFAHLLQEAQLCQHRHATLQASPDGLGIYERAGFTAVGNAHVFENRALL